MDDMLTMHPGLPCRLASMPSSGRKACATSTTFISDHMRVLCQVGQALGTCGRMIHECMQPAGHLSRSWRRFRCIGRLTMDKHGKFCTITA